ncbi:MAG TPA: VOC family protein [Acidimicrobiales bacterium]|nr:VOC family protein [Acidimicrobiales bacterium]
MTTTPAAPTVWPALHCADAKGLIKFLVDAFGFEESLVVEDGGVVHHAELKWPLGGGGIMLGDAGAHDDELHAQLPTGPASICVACDDPDALFARATACGATVLQSVGDKDYGSRDFTVKDPAGNVWTFGTYRGA